MSTRRARIKAVAVLPPRRKNAEKKNVDEAKEGFEANLPGVNNNPLSVEKSPKKRRISKEGHEDGMSSRSLRISDDKSPRGLRLSIEKTPKEHLISIEKVSEDSYYNKQTASGSIGIDKTPKHLSSKSLPEGNETETPSSSQQVNKTRKCSSIKTPQMHTLSTDEVANRFDNIYHMSVASSPKQGSSSKAHQILANKTVKHSPIRKIRNLGPIIESTPVDETNEKSMRKESFIQTTAPTKCTEVPSEKNTSITDQSKPNIQTHQNVPSVKLSTSIENSSKNTAKETTESTPFFASPDPVTRASVVVRTPVIEVDLIAEKLIAPHKGPQTQYRHINHTKNLHKPLSESELITPEDLAIDVRVDNINSNKCCILENALTGGKKNSDQIQILDDFVIKPLQEASTVMDGIIPLKPARNVPKPLDILKNEIISENAQVFFDPIIPLPSPTKARPKLRPAPRLTPRRNSIQQGSASESEDDNRRLHSSATPVPSRQRDVQTPLPSRQRHDSHTPTLLRQRHVSETHPRQRHDSQTSQTQPLVQKDVARVRNDSVCSNMSQPASQITAIGSPLRDRQKIRRDEQARRNTALRKRKLDVDRDKLTMYDLIFYNPTSNPIIPDEDELKAKEENAKDKAEAELKAKIEKDSGKEPEAAPVAVPQIKLGPNGEIILDEQSLVINQFDTRKLQGSVVREGAWGGSNSTAYRRQPRTADWTNAETVRFYRALASLGTDFSMMTPLFPKRTRRDLKLKFKKEERSNFAQVDKALRSGTKFDPTGLEKEFNEERKQAAEEVKRAKERLQREKEEDKQRKIHMRNLKKRPSRCAKSLGMSALPSLKAGKTNPTTIDEYVNFQLERNTMAKKCGQKRTTSPVVPMKKHPIPTTPFMSHPARKKTVTLRLVPNTSLASPSAPNTSVTSHSIPITPVKTNGEPKTSKTRKPKSPKTIKPKTVVSPSRSPNPSLAALKLLERHAKKVPKTVSTAPAQTATTIVAGLEVASRLPQNLEPGSVVLMTVNDPTSPTTQVLHAFYAKGQGEFATVNPTLLGGLGTLIKSNCSKTSSPRAKTPIASTRNRKSSYTITQLE